MRSDVLAFVGQQASHALLAGSLAVAHFMLVRHDRRQFLSLWGGAWVAIAGFKLLTAIEAASSVRPGIIQAPALWLGFANDWLGFIALAALAAGSHAFRKGRDVPRPVLGWLAGAAAILALLTSVIAPEFLRYPLRLGGAAVGCLVASFRIWRSARMLAGSIGAYAVPMAGYAVAALQGDGSRPEATLDRLVAIGHLDAVAMTAMALSMIVWLLSGERVTAAAAIDREKSLRADIEASEARFRSILDQVPDGIAVLDAEGRYLVDLRPHRRFLGIPNDRLIGGSMFGLVHPDDRDRTIASFASLRDRPGAVATAEIRVRHAEGHWMVLECSGTNCENVPSLGGILVVARDVTERRGLERRLAEAERLETVGRLAGGVAHDFNNLLTVVQGNASLLVQALPSDSMTRAYAEEIAAAALKGAHLTHHLLAFARREPVAPRVIDLNHLITDLLPILRRLAGESIVLDWRPAPVPAVIRADPHRIEQVFLNLCANARDAMPNGGSLRVHADRDPPEMVTLRIEDTGTGMTEDTKLRAFDPFFTTKPAGTGTGLGLATSYGIVQQAGGTIGIDSEPGRGTCVTLQFPATREQPPAAAKAPAGNRARG